MPYVVRRPGGTWELREAASTSDGPRSRTLATFRALTPDVIEHARSRASGPLSTELVQAAARRAGAPVPPPPADDAAGRLLSELAAGRRPRAALRTLLRDALGDEDGQAASDPARAAAAWVSASARERGAALHDLLLLADRLPAPRTRPRTRFPRLESRTT